MAVDQEPDSEVTAEIKIEEIDGGHATCFMTVELEKNVPPVGELPPELGSRDGLQTVDARN